MPYLFSEITDPDAVYREATAPPPMGPGFGPDVAVGADRLEVWGSLFSDPGDDWCEFRLFRGSEEIARRRVRGY